jgi:hypothetical protein
MSIDEVMQIAAEYREASTYSEKCVARIILRTAIKQHVAEAVKVEREELLDLVDRYAKDNADLKAAIRARAEKETT